MKTKLFLFIILSVCMIGSASALFDTVNELEVTPGVPITIGNVSVNYTTLWQSYKPIEIRTLLGLASLVFSGAITQHTQDCAIDCYTEMQVYLPSNMNLSDSIRFYDYDTSLYQSIRGYRMYWSNTTYQQNITDRAYSCSLGTNATTGQPICGWQTIGTHNETRQNYTRYTVGSQLFAGNYYIRLEGQKKASRNIDWQIKVDDIWITTWANWTGNRPNFSTSVSYWTFDNYANFGKSETGIRNFTQTGSLNNGTNCVFSNCANVDGNSKNNFLWQNKFMGNSTNPNGTFSFWFRFSDNVGGVMFDRGCYGCGGGLITELYGQVEGGTNKLVIDVDDDFQVLSNTIAPGTFYFITYAWNRTGTAIYLNGTRVYNSPNVPSVSNDGVEIFFKQNSTGDQFKNLTIDEASFWNSTFSDSQVQALYDAYSASAITLNSPPDNFFSTGFVIFNASANINGLGVNLTNMSLWGNFNGSWSLNQSKNVSGQQNQSIFNLTLLPGIYIWNVRGCDTDGDCGFGKNNRTLIISPIDLNGSSFNNNTFETAEEKFQINITKNPAFITLTFANLIYDNKTYSMTNIFENSTFATFSRVIDIPLIVPANQEVQTKQFYFNIFGSGPLGNLFFNSSTFNQTVNAIHLQQCNNTITIMGLNFTAWDEENLTRISPYRFAGTFNYYLGNGSVYENYSTGNLSVIEQNICISPQNKTFIHNTIIEYGFSNENITYVTRNYYFDRGRITNISQDIYLYLLNAEHSTTFIQELLDQNLIGIPGAYINILRYYPANNTFNTVQVSKTDDNGKTVGFYQVETVDYKHIITLNGSVIFTDNPRKISVEELPARIKFILGDNNTSPWKQFQGRDNLFENLSYDENNHLITFSYIDTSGSFTSARLVVILDNYNISATEICNTQVTQPSGVIQCNITGIQGTFTAKAYIGRSPETLADLIVIIVKTALDHIGLLLGILVILGAYLVTLYDINVGLITGAAVTVLVNMTPLTDFPPLYIFALLALTVMALVVVNKR